MELQVEKIKAAVKILNCNMVDLYNTSKLSLTTHYAYVDNG